MNDRKANPKIVTINPRRAGGVWSCGFLCSVAMCHHKEPAFNSRTMLCMLSPSQGLTVQQLLQTAPFPLLNQLIKKKYPHTAGNYKTLQEPVMPRTFIQRHTSVPSALEADLFQKSFHRCSRKDGYGHSPFSMSDYILKGYSLSLKIPILLKNSNPSSQWEEKNPITKEPALVPMLVS